MHSYTEYIRIYIHTFTLPKLISKISNPSEETFCPIPVNNMIICYTLEYI